MDIKRFFIIAITILPIFISCRSKANLLLNDSSKKARNEVLHKIIQRQDSVIELSEKYLNVPYRYGGSSPKGFDCSGFTSFVFGKFGYSLLRSSHEQAEQFPIVSRKELQRGDLVFFEGRKHNKRVGHVGIVVDPKENGEFNFIHASVQSGVIISESVEPYYASRFIKAGRVIENRFATTKSDEKTTPNNDISTLYKAGKSDVSADAVYHTVEKGETLSAISKKYDVPISTIQFLNKLKSKKIKTGQKLLIIEGTKSNIENENPSEKVDTGNIKKEATTFVEKEQKNDNGTIEHKVLAGESLYSISKKYNITVDELKQINGLTSNAINAGQRLYVSHSTLNTKKETEIIPQSGQSHTVQKGETLYSISRKHGCTVADLQKWNPHLTETLRIGQKIEIKQ